MTDIGEQGTYNSKAQKGGSHQRTNQVSGKADGKRSYDSFGCIVVKGEKDHRDYQQVGLEQPAGRQGGLEDRCSEDECGATEPPHFIDIKKF